MTREIPLTQGQVALVSDDAYERVSKIEWWAVKTRIVGKFYAQGRVNGKNIYLHVFLMQPPPGFNVDHKDRNGLNCQWENMRLATHINNAQNRNKRSDNLSGYKGVSFNKKIGKFEARITLNRTRISLGLYDTAEEAAHVYDTKACEFFVEFAVLNFPDEWRWVAEESIWKKVEVFQDA